MLLWRLLLHSYIPCVNTGPDQAFQFTLIQSRRFADFSKAMVWLRSCPCCRLTPAGRWAPRGCSLISLQHPAEKENKTKVVQRQSLPTLHGQIDAQTVPELKMVKFPLGPALPFYHWAWRYMPWNISLVSQVICLVVSSPNLLCTPQSIHCLFTVGAEWETAKAFALCKHFQQELKHPCVINTVLGTNLNHTTIRAAVKTITFIPARPSRVLY